MVGFGRDGDAHSVGKYRPNMTILQVAANRDLQLPWLKEDKTDSAFAIVSEPEVRSSPPAEWTGEAGGDGAELLQPVSRNGGGGLTYVR